MNNFLVLIICQKCSDTRSFSAIKCAHIWTMECSYMELPASADKSGKRSVKQTCTDVYECI